MSHSFTRFLKASVISFAALLPTTHAIAQSDGPAVVTSIKPLHALAARVMQGAGEPALLIEGAASPHTYNMKPSQARLLQEADLVFWVGEDLETFLAKPVSGADLAGKTVTFMETPGLVLLEARDLSLGGGDAHAHGDEHGHGDEHAHADEHDHGAKHAHADEHDHGHDDKHAHADEHDHAHDAAHKEEHADSGGHHDDHGHGHGHHHDGDDPHVWLDPENAKVMAAAMARALAEADPANAALYERNASEAAAELDALTAELRDRLAPLAGRSYVSFHDAYQYFDNRFGVRFAGAIAVNPEAPPGAKRLRDLQSALRSESVSCVFSEPQFPDGLVATVTEGASVRTGLLDPLGAEIEPGPDMYATLLNQMADAFVECVGTS
ncbi:MAG: zinc ABC transporter substrate-binding protein [Alphaproteobacteria bacterium]|nr:zinc ABC transporter substrate-binding protein [Alphaproteobacteria bacterium]